ncbi:cytochrome c biogenesis CcdA family protein [Candidatus Latescibacterota bacterium]
MLICFFALSGQVLAADMPSMLFYYSSDCEHCIAIKKDFLPGFLEKYGEHFEFTELEVSNDANRDSLYAMESRLNFPEADKDYPAVYFMGTMLEGENDIRLKLEYIVGQYLANPDSSWQFNNEVMSRIPDIIDIESMKADKIIHMAYFYKEGCKECGRASEIIDWLGSIYGVVEIDRFDIQDKQNKITATALGIRAGIPENRLMSTPIFFIGGDDYLLSEDISKNALAEMINIYSKTGAPPVWESFTQEEIAGAEGFLKEQFKSFAFFAVALAGLGDGINPCAFATILFFVSYLGMVGRKKNEILIVGLSFASAVFVTYFLVGLGFLQFIKTMTNIELMAKVIFGGTSILCIIFGFLSIYDYFKAKEGNTGDMMLQLPAFLKKRIHKTIREKSRMKSMVAGALIAGFMVSILEFACTGQVYLPTITFMVGVEGLKSTAILYLVLYNIFFIVPLLLVFAVVYFGVSSQAISRRMESKVGTVKLILAGVFFTVGGLLFWAAFM